ncbi:YeiH family protein [Pedobacter rhizosphaerae]|uniref:Conserved hypothetical integral membrane protein n=1 Tax=Pedobacter rhizosphaerae TaxID=390241 RepID=A0A1H9L726_9SPHI|nr:putative sulfate exporter family transporter [Pedobacter rhizosphaerae]SER07029.1 conserved hypothetical integral membrane protein [Pedobacter rhizosphaerae]
MALIKKQLEVTLSIPKIAFIAMAVLCLFPFISAPIALILGFSITLFFGHPFESETTKLTPILLQLSVVGMGFGMNLNSAIEVGKTGILLTICTLTTVLLLGFVLTKLFKVDHKVGFLISVGTAICGGSAIAATSPLVKAKTQQISVSLAAVFVLNAIALLIFPAIGKLLHLTQEQFGLWCAVAIQDTSSVVGASSKYGTKALEIATTVKLARALWIIPVSLFSIRRFKTKETRLKIPYFIAFFLLAMILNTYLPIPPVINQTILTLSKSSLIITLFLIGAGLSLPAIKSIGFKPFILAVILWIFISCSALLFIC